MTELHRSIDQELGYTGSDRFVCFYYDARSGQVCWRDMHSSGAGCTGWPPPLATIATHARVNLGNARETGDHALLLDREGQEICFVYREEAQEFLARRGAAA